MFYFLFVAFLLVYVCLFLFFAFLLRFLENYLDIVVLKVKYYCKLFFVAGLFSLSKKFIFLILLYPLFIYKFGYDNAFLEYSNWLQQSFQLFCLFILNDCIVVEKFVLICFILF